MTVMTVVTASYLRHIIIYMAKRAVQAQWLAQLDRVSVTDNRTWRRLIHVDAASRYWTVIVDCSGPFKTKRLALTPYQCAGHDSIVYCLNPMTSDLQT
jgi:hypothetical protein